MSKTIQVAFKLSAADLDAVDALVPAHHDSRAAALRSAVRELLRRRRDEAIEDALETGYRDVPPTAEEARWAETSVEGLAGADVEW